LVQKTAITAPDGTAGTLFRIDEGQLTAKLKTLVEAAGTAGGKPELLIPATDNSTSAAKGAVTVSIPVSPFAAATGTLPSDGKVVIQTNLGEVVLPWAVLSQWTTGTAAGKHVELSLRPVSESMQTSLAGKLQATGASGLVEALELSLGVKEGETVSTLTLPANSKGVLSLSVKTDAAPGQLTVLKLNEQGGLSFVPAKVGTAASGLVTAQVRLENAALTLAVVQVEPVSYGDMNGHWAEQAVGLLSSKLVVDGMEGGFFQPESMLTRAQYSAMLVRALGFEASASAAGGSFTDVAADSWYSATVQAAVKAGITDGYEDGSFRPEARITREEMAVMLYRALHAVDTAPAADASVLAGLSDSGELAGWSRDAVSALVTSNLLNGRTEGGFAPAADATRAEAAAVLQRLLGYLEARWF
jgi:hypothetical protein